MKIGIVSTCRGLGPEYLTALMHHVRIGVDRIYVVLDDPEFDASFAAKVSRDPSLSKYVRFVNNDSAHKEKVRKFSIYQQLQEEIYYRSVVSRQLVNTAIVSKLAMEESISWLYHIDSDELIDPGEGRSIRDYFQSIPPHIQEVMILNREAMPHKFEFDDVFKEIFRFKKNYFESNGLQTEYALHRVKRPQFFIFYGTFKSAFRPSLAERYETPASVHQFSPDYFDSSCRVEDREPIRILHYPVSSLSRLISRISGFNANRINQYEMIDKDTDGFFPAARRAAASADPAQALTDLYREWLLYDDQAEIDDLKARGLIVEKDPEWLSSSA